MKESKNLLMEEAHYRLYLLMQSHSPRTLDDCGELEKRKLGAMDGWTRWHWNNDKLFKMSPDDLAAFAKKYVIDPEQWEQGIETPYADTRCLVRAVLDIEAAKYGKGYAEGYDDGYRRGASLAVQRVKEWIDRRAREFVFSPASMIPALKAEVKLDELTPEP